MIKLLNMIKNKNFALIGASGYIAPRHMKSIKDTNNNLLVVELVAIVKFCLSFIGLRKEKLVLAL